FGAARALGIDEAAAVRGLAAARGVPGRLERVAGEAPFEVVVDYAHTPDALARALAACREHAAGRLLLVFGCGGDRDRGKRPLMGRIAGESSDRAWVTNDNPRGEDPRAIADAIVAGSARPLTLPQVAQMAGGDLVAPGVPAAPAAREAWLRSGIDGASIDTRTLRPGDLFVPLPGSRADGHAFLEEAFQRGAAAALCARAHAAGLAGHEPGPLIVVEDVTEGLMRLARRYREGWRGLLLCVTGSAGKTTTKELVAAALGTA